MAYRLVYMARVDWVPAGLGSGLSNPTGPGINGGPAQTLAFFNTEGGSFPPYSSTFTAGDITTLLASMTTDLSTQMNAAIGRVQGFSSGGG